MSDQKKPGIVATATATSNIPLIESSTYGAICCSMALIGTVKDSYQGRPTEQVKVRIAWALPTETYETQDGKTLPRVIGKEYTLSLSEKAILKKDLEAWRGKQFTAEELEGFDITAVLGKKCMLSIGKKTSKTSGKEYNVISSVSALMKGLTIEAPEGMETVLFSYSIEDDKEFLAAFSKFPNFVQDEIVKTPEWAKRGLTRPVQEQTSSVAGAPNDEVTASMGPIDDDDLPF